eukprot:s613_g2.t1
MLWGTDEVWVDVIMVFAHGRSGERMRSWWTLSWFDPWMLWGAQEDKFGSHREVCDILRGKVKLLPMREFVAWSS